MNQSTTHDPFRQMIDEWDAAAAPQSPIYPDSIEWNNYLSDRDLCCSVEPVINDVEWLEIQADSYRSVGSDVARLAADALSGLAGAMAGAGHFDAAGYRDSLDDRGTDLARAMDLDRAAAAA